MKEIEGVIKSIIYEAKDYYVFVIDIEKSNEVCCVGNITHIYIGEKVILRGEFETNKRYGVQFRFKEFEKKQVSSVLDMEKYLSSSLFVGIGAKTSKKIVEHFKNDTLDIINNNIDRLVEVDGIGPKKLVEIKSAIKDRVGNRQIIVELTMLGISIKNANIIYDIFRENSINIVKEDPYILIDKLKGFGFKRADSIGRRLEVDKNSFNRIKYGMISVLKEKLKFGNTFIPYDELIKLSSELLEINREKIEGVYGEFLKESNLIEKILIDENNIEIRGVFLTSVYLSEYEICSTLIRLYIYSKISININFDKEIEDFEKENNIRFSQDQIQALKGSFSNSVQVITGGPGTGKTTIIRFILHTFRKNNLKVIMVAPTGRAAKRMMETTGFEAKTIHRVLEIGTTSDDYDYEFIGKDDKNNLDCDVIIIDEASMIDVLIGSKLFKSLKIGTKIIIVGDVDQLPSVGPGNFLKDIIESDIFPVCRLNKIYRQGENSYIVLNAHRINNREELILNKKDGDFYILRSDDEQKSLDLIKDLILYRLPKFFSNSIDNIKDIQILSPTRKGILGVNNLNVVLRNILNQKDEKEEFTHGDFVFRVGDKVMQTKNNYEITGYYIDSQKQVKGIFNGDIGYIKSIYDGKISVIYDGSKVIKYDRITIGELEHAYAITIHKSQGSEFPVVIIPVFNFSNILMNKNLLYTAVTRAKKYVVLVGSLNSLKYMVNNKCNTLRYSALRYLFNEVVKISQNNEEGNFDSI